MTPLSPSHWLALGAIVALGAMVQTSMGFGAMLVSVSLGALLLPVSEVVPLLVPLSVVASGVVAVQKRRDIVWELLLGQVLPLMGLGMAITVAFVDADGPWLRPALGGLIGVLALRGLIQDGQGTPPAPIMASVGMVGAGLVQGLFATGGPLLVWALGQRRLDKGAFRATIVVVWMVLNSALYGSFLLAGRATPSTALASAGLLPGALVGVVAGHWVHDRVDEDRFRKGLWGALLVAAALLVAQWR